MDIRSRINVSQVILGDELTYVGSLACFSVEVAIRLSRVACYLNHILS